MTVARPVSCPLTTSGKSAPGRVGLRPNSPLAVAADIACLYSGDNGMPGAISTISSAHLGAAKCAMLDSATMAFARCSIAGVTVLPGPGGGGIDQGPADGWRCSWH